MTEPITEPMTEPITEPIRPNDRRPGRCGQADADENRRQVLYWRLLAQLFDREEQAALESAGVAVVKDIGLPHELLDPRTPWTRSFSATPSWPPSSTA